jgi:hypothetical protein
MKIQHMLCVVLFAYMLLQLAYSGYQRSQVDWQPSSIFEMHTMNHTRCYHAGSIAIGLSVTSRGTRYEWAPVEQSELDPCNY